jgi:hypothetical protein
LHPQRPLPGLRRRHRLHNGDCARTTEAFLVLGPDAHTRRFRRCGEIPVEPVVECHACDFADAGQRIRRIVRSRLERSDRLLEERVDRVAALYVPERFAGLAAVPLQAHPGAPTEQGHENDNRSWDMDGAQ